MSRCTCSAPPGLAPQDHAMWCPIYPRARHSAPALAGAESGPIDWPARFRAAAEAAEKGEWDAVVVSLRFVAREMQQWMSAEEVDAIGRALLGEDR